MLPLNDRKKLIVETGDTLTLTDPSLLVNWSNNVQNIPNISWPDVVNFLPNKTSNFTGEKLKAYRSLEAYNYYLNGHVQECYINVDHSTFTVVKTKVLPSQRQSKNIMYDVWICAHKEGWISSANCTCMAGLGSVCSHVAATLFKLQAAVHLQLNKKAPTEVLCQWNISKKKLNLPR